MPWGWLQRQLRLKSNLSLPLGTSGNITSPNKSGENTAKTLQLLYESLVGLHPLRVADDGDTWLHYQVTKLGKKNSETSQSFTSERDPRKDQTMHYSGYD